MTNSILVTDLVPRGSKGIVDLRKQEIREQVNAETIIQRYLNSLDSIHTKKSYERCIRSFFLFLYGDNTPLNLQMLLIDPIHAQKYESYWKSQLDNKVIKTSTFNSKIKGIKSFYEWLIYQTKSNILGYSVFTVNPFEKISQKSENDSDGSEPLTEDEVSIMLENPYGNTPHTKERNTLMFILAITTGIRNWALLNITENDVKKHGVDWIIEAEDKERKVAKMSINPYYERLMKWYRIDKLMRSDKQDATIFGINPNTANRIIKQWAENVGIVGKNITFHSLRTTTAVQIYHNTDGNVFKVQKALNHSHIETSKIYLDKEDTVNHDGEGIIENILNADSKFQDAMSRISKEDLVSILSEMSVNNKLMILRSIEKKGL